MARTAHRADVVVIGAGIAGLASAHELVRSARGVRVAVLEAASRCGGKIQRSTIGPGHVIDVGPDALVTASPAVRQLCADVGLADALVSPTNATVGVCHRGAVRALPAGLVAGVPVSPVALVRSRLLSARGVLRASGDLVAAATAVTSASSVADLVGDRLGEEVLTRLVAPLVEGMYAGDVEYLSAQYATPALFHALSANRSLILGLRRSRAPSLGGLATFAPDGLSALVDALVNSLSGEVDLRTDSPVRLLERGSTGWIATTDEDAWSCEHVVVAVPAQPAARLVAPSYPHQARQLADVRYASVITVTLALPACGEARVAGCVVPRGDQHLVTAFTRLSDRWAHHRLGDTMLVRCSLGRDGDDRAWRMSEEALVARVRDELSSLAHVDASSGEVVVQRWADALPQYGPGHGAMLESVRELEADGLAFVGAAYGGVGIASCIDQASALARRLTLVL